MSYTDRRCHGCGRGRGPGECICDQAKHDDEAAKLVVEFHRPDPAKPQPEPRLGGV